MGSINRTEQHPCRSVAGVPLYSPMWQQMLPDSSGQRVAISVASGDPTTANSNEPAFTYEL